MTETFALLDREHLKAMTGGDNDLAVEVIEIFRHQAEIWSRMLDPHAEPMGRRRPHAQGRQPWYWCHPVGVEM